MSTPNYAHLLLALCFLYGAVRYTFSQRLFGHAPRWPFLLGCHPMSPFSRWLQFSIYVALVVWEGARAFWHVESSLLVAVIAVTALISLGAAYRHDRRTNAA